MAESQEEIIRYVLNEMMEGHFQVVQALHYLASALYSDPPPLNFERILSPRLQEKIYKT